MLPTLYASWVEVANAASSKRIACPRTHPKVTDGQDHFPMDTIGRARNALARVAAFKAAPKWWSGTLAALVALIKRRVRQWWPSVNVTP